MATTNDTFRFRYEFVVDHVWDGDTMYGELDLGLGLWLGNSQQMKFGIRFWGINAPALTEPGGPEAQAFVADRVKPGDTLTIDSYNWDEFRRRIDGVPYLEDGTNLCQALLDAGLATPYTNS